MDKGLFLVQFPGTNLFVVIFDRTNLGRRKQIITYFHLPLTGLEHPQRLGHVRDNRLLAILRHGHIVVNHVFVLLQLDLFGIDHYKLQIGGMAGIHQSGNQRIESHRFT